METNIELAKKILLEHYFINGDNKIRTQNPIRVEDLAFIMQKYTDHQAAKYNINKRFSKPEKMAEWLHNNYEEIAISKGWKTQDTCRVPFLELPKENKETMIELCCRFINIECNG